MSCIVRRCKKDIEAKKALKRRQRARGLIDDREYEKKLGLRDA